MIIEAKSALINREILDDVKIEVVDGVILTTNATGIPDYIVNGTLIPGFVDMHCHGGGGFYFSAKSEDEIVCRNVRISCSAELPDRQLTVDIPGYPIFEQRRWSAYHGFVKYHPDQLIYNVASPPPTLTPEHVSVAAYSCVDTIQATIELMEKFTDKMKGRDQSVDQITDLSFLNHM